MLHKNGQMMLLPLLLALLSWGCGGDSNPSETCSDGVKNQNETDVDCGGVCAGCAEGESCLADSDCASGNCDAGSCAPAGGPTCDDGVQNGDETDVDCGGPDCDPCADGESCADDSDCASGNCDAGSCAAVAATCDDGELNGDETDVDCGGPDCDPCADGASCNTGTDCQSGYCDAGSCGQPPAHCSNDTLDEDETDVDCGGADCPACENGQGCADNSDCASGYCDAGSCAELVEHCDNDTQDEDETDVDCGGADCPPCADGQGCSDNSDCVSGNCDAGTCSAVEDLCPDDPNKTEPGICGCGVADVDSDGDGTMDCNDGCPDDADKTEEGQCGCGNPDTDSDGDGSADCIDGCPDDPDKTEAGACGCGVADSDSDGDGTADCIDGCPDDPDKIEEGQCGCGVADVDSDGDGSADCIDGCPDDPDKIEEGQCGCGVADTDSDGDGTADCIDGCPDDPNKTEPGVCGCGTADDDSDGDGTADCNDGCPDDPNKIEPGVCGCGVADDDSDGDGTADCNDGCPLDAFKTEPGSCGCNQDDSDSDADGTLDCEDPDDDNDGLPDVTDVCPLGEYGGICITRLSNDCVRGSADAFCEGYGRVITFDEFQRIAAAGWTRPNNNYHTLSVLQDPHCDFGSGTVGIPGWGNFTHYRCGDEQDYCHRAIMCVSGSYTFNGVAQNLPERDLTGWEKCWRGTYGNSDSLADMLTACEGDELLLGCRPVGSDTLTLAAMGRRSAVLHDCGNDSGCVYQSNGVGWYYSDGYSWGFANGGQPVQRTSCDTNRDDDPQLRMCWHTGNGNIESGYRCGDNSLNGNNDWERVIYRPSPAPGFHGVLQNMAEDYLAESWDTCWTGTYGNQEPLADILTPCDSNSLMLACRPVGEPSYTLSAMGPREAVLHDCGTDSACVFQYNGVGWYYSTTWSWGFARGGQPVQRSSCDVNRDDDPQLRMCWHTGSDNIQSGYRCGDNSLNADNDWERLVLVPQLPSCFNNPQWMPVDCTDNHWVWSSDRDYDNLQAANQAHVLWTGCSHADVPNTCSLDGRGWVSTAVTTMSGCDSDWLHIAPNNNTFACGGHDGDQVRRLVLGDDDCYDY